MVLPCNAAPGKVLAHSGNPPCIRWFGENRGWRMLHSFPVPLIVGGAGIALYDACFLRDGILWSGVQQVSHCLPNRRLPVFTTANLPTGVAVGKTLLAADRVAFVSSGSFTDGLIRLLSCNSGEFVASYATGFKPGHFAFAALRLVFAHGVEGVHALYRGDSRELFRFLTLLPIGLTFVRRGWLQHRIPRSACLTFEENRPLHSFLSIVLLIKASPSVGLPVNRYCA